MDDKRYLAYVAEETKSGFEASVKEKSVSELPEGEVLVRVHYSSLNYKDALSASGHKGVTTNYPHTPGIDAAGFVEECSTADFESGDEVIVTSYDLGMNTPGGFGQYIRVPAQWVVPLPDGLSLRESMMFGTAGFTAGMAVHEILKETPNDKGEVLVTGSTGGVGSFAVAILARLGYRVVAVTGKPDAHEYLKQLGAARIISRQEALDKKERPLLRPMWAAVVDTVGGEMLANAIKSTMQWGIVAVCGNVASPNLPINVFPFILRGVKVAGIDSANCEMPHRKEIWNKLAAEWKPDLPKDTFDEIRLAGLDDKIQKILRGQIRGRVLVEL